jgi:glycine cleavage system H protein
VANPSLWFARSKESVAMPSPNDRRYSESHEWFRADGDVVTMGITKYAADELTDITYVEVKPSGTPVKAGGSVGEVESVKTTSDVYSAVSGSIVEVNKAVSADPSLLNSDPYGKGWLVKIKTADPSPLQKLMDQATYDRKHPVS